MDLKFGSEICVCIQYIHDSFFKPRALSIRHLELFAHTRCLQIAYKFTLLNHKMRKKKLSKIESHVGMSTYVTFAHFQHDREALGKVVRETGSKVERTFSVPKTQNDWVCLSSCSHRRSRAFWQRRVRQMCCCLELSHIACRLQQCLLCCCVLATNVSVKFEHG